MTVQELEKAIEEVVKSEDSIEDRSQINSCEDERSKMEENEELLIEEQSEEEGVDEE